MVLESHETQSFEAATLVSVIICNFNYERFVGEAIYSALSIDWPNVEVIVVDDGSTDGSAAVIQRFLPQGVKVLLRPHTGQAGATSEGYRQSRGSWTIFLDADDVIDPSAVREAVAVLRPGWSMIQFQMRTIDEHGRSLDNIFPKYRKDTSPESIRDWVSQTDNYPTPPNSGNFLSREFLDKIFPFEAGMDRAPDSYFISTAPFLGDVLTVNKPLVSYRVHGKNIGAQTVLKIEKLQTELERHLRRCSYGTRIAAKYGITVSPDRWRYGFYNLAMRIGSLRLSPDKHPLDGDSVRRFIYDCVVSMIKPQGLTPLRHTAMSLWLLFIAVAPKGMIPRLISWRYVPSSRPLLVRRFLRGA